MSLHFELGEGRVANETVMSLTACGGGVAGCCSVTATRHLTGVTSGRKVSIVSRCWRVVWPCVLRRNTVAVGACGRVVHFLTAGSRGGAGMQTRPGQSTAPSVSSFHTYFLLPKKAGVCFKAN